MLACHIYSSFCHTHLGNIMDQTWTKWLQLALYRPTDNLMLYVPSVRDSEHIGRVLFFHHESSFHLSQLFSWTRAVKGNHRVLKILHQWCCEGRRRHRFQELLNKTRVIEPIQEVLHQDYWIKCLELQHLLFWLRTSFAFIPSAISRRPPFSVLRLHHACKGEGKSSWIACVRGIEDVKLPLLIAIRFVFAWN